MEGIEIYIEKTPSGKRTFTLDGGILRISSHQYLVHKVITPPMNLNNVKDETGTIYVRLWNGPLALVIFVVCLLVAMVIANEFFSFNATLERISTPFIFTFPFLSILLYFRTVRFEQFYDVNGQVLFDVGRVGGRKNQKYEAFMSILRSRIAHTTSNNTGP